MSKTTVGELRNLVKDIEKEKILEYKGMEIKLITYLPILKKIGLVSSIYQSAINDEDNLCLINYNSLDISFKIMFIETYTNITLPKNIIDAFDLITEIGLFDFVYNKLPESEKVGLQHALDNYIEEKQERYERENSLPNLVGNMLEDALGKIPSGDELKKIVGELGKEMKGFDPAKMDFVKKAIGWNSGEVDGESK